MAALDSDDVEMRFGDEIEEGGPSRGQSQLISGTFARLKDTIITTDHVKSAISTEKSDVVLETLTIGIAIDLMRLVDAGAAAFGVVSNKADALRRLIVALVSDCTSENVMSKDLLWKKVNYARKKSGSLKSSNRNSHFIEEFQWRIKSKVTDTPPIKFESGLEGSSAVVDGDEPPISPRSMMRRLYDVETDVAAARAQATTAETDAAAARAQATTAKTEAATARVETKRLSRRLDRREHVIARLEEQIQELQMELAELRRSTDRRNQQQRERRMMERLNKLSEDLAAAMKSTDEAEQRASSLDVKVKHHEKLNERARSRTYRARSSLGQARESLSDVASRIKQGIEEGTQMRIETREEKGKGRPFTPAFRRLVMDLLSLGFAQEKIVDAIQANSHFYGHELSELPTYETVRRIGAEAGVIAEVAAAHRWIDSTKDNDGVSLYTDSTGHRNVDMMPLIGGDLQRGADGKMHPSTFIMGLKRLPSHTSDDQYCAIIDLLDDLAKVGDEFGLDDTDRLSLRYLMVSMADHAADQGKLHEMLEETKAQEWRDYLGMMVSDKEKEKPEYATIIRAACGMHKLNIMSRGAKDAMKQWRDGDEAQKLELSKPIPLPNKGVFNAVLRFESTEEEAKDMLENLDPKLADSGGYKAMGLLSMLFSNPDAKMGYGDVWRGFKERHELDIKLVYVSDVRFSSAEANAGPVLKNSARMVEFLEAEKEGKESGKFNNLERNVANALKDDSTLDELAVMGIVFTLVHVPFLKVVRSRCGLGAVMKDVLPMENRMEEWVGLDDDQLLKGLIGVYSRTADALKDVAGRFIEEKGVYDGFKECVERAVSRRHCLKMLKVVMTRMKDKLKGTLESFAEGGEYADLDGILSGSLDYTLATNDVSEGALGQLRQRYRRAPNARLDTVVGMIMFHHNVGDSSAISDKTIRAVVPVARDRLAESDGKMLRKVMDVKEERRKEKVKRDKAVAEQNAKREREIRAVLPVVDIEKIKSMKGDALSDQLRRWQLEIGKELLVLSQFKKVEEKRKKLKLLFEEHPDTLAKLKAVRESMIEEEKIEQGREKKRKFDEDHPFGDEWY